MSPSHFQSKEALSETNRQLEPGIVSATKDTEPFSGIIIYSRIPTDFRVQRGLD